MPIYLDNVSSGDVFTYSLVYVCGRCVEHVTDSLSNASPKNSPRKSPRPMTTQDTPDGSNCLHLTLVPDEVCDQTVSYQSAIPVHKGLFKAFIQLRRGVNQVNFYWSEDSLTFELSYEQTRLSRYIRPLYIICKDDDGHFQAPDSQDNSVQSAVRRISFAVKLLQTFTAEKLNEHGFGQKTFALPGDVSGSDDCEVFVSELTLSQVLQMTSLQLWSHFARELVRRHTASHTHQCKWLAVLSFTRYSVPPDHATPTSNKDIIKCTRGHCSLGGGGLALIGSATLHTWPTDLSQLFSCFTDERAINRNYLMDDSAYRGTYWACLASSLGGALHELGHTLDLGHTSTGIMARGFDDIHRFFLIRPPDAPPMGSVPPSPVGSPAHQPRHRNVSSSSISPRSWSPSQRPSPSRQRSSDGSPSLVHREGSFRRSSLQSQQTMTVTHRDGTVSQTCVTRQGEGRERRLTLNHHHQEIRVTETIGSAPTERCVLSMTCTNPPLQSGVHEDIALSDDHVYWFRPRRCHGGAHWYRSSAVLLNYHKWLNPDYKQIHPPPEVKGGLIHSDVGLVLVEVRSDDNVVLHHWEWTNHHPFTHPLPHPTPTLLAMDVYGAILKVAAKNKDCEN